MKKIITLLTLIVCLNARAQQYTKLFDFNALNGVYGAIPLGSLISDGTFLYGMTSTGGLYGKGVVFKIKNDGTSYDTLLNFNGANGNVPRGSLISDGSYLYGMTSEGGTSNVGVIFKIKFDGTEFDTLLNFNTVNGYEPFGSLFYDGTYLYGMVEQGGTIGGGPIFRIKSDGTDYTQIFNFNGYNGERPLGSLISDGTYFYGMTEYGGSHNNNGVIFKLKSDGTSFDTLTSFNGYNGAEPSGDLIYDGTYLYGMTYDGGYNYNPFGDDGFGVIFKIKPDGTNFDTLICFNGLNGASPKGSLIYDGIYLYGTTAYGGTNNSGNVFRIKPDGTNYTNLFNFDETNGKNPTGSLVSDGTYLYGTTSEGGNSDNTVSYGVIFRIKITCTDTIIQNPKSICAGDNYAVGTHTYTSMGTYFDTLHTVLGCDSIIITQLTVNPTISYVLSHDTTTPHIWYATPFIIDGASPFTYLWSWGDGSTSDTLYTSHTYTAAAHYNVCLTVTDANGCSAQYCENDSLYRTSQDESMIQINVINSTSSISQVSGLNSKMSIYPNPTNSILHVTGIKPQDEIKIYDVLGSQVLQSRQSTIDVSNLSNGVYFIRIGNQSQKTIKQ